MGLFNFACPTADGLHVLVCDAGTDQILRYPLAGQNDVAAMPDLVLQAAAGSLPRHLEILPDGQRLFAVSELGNSISTWRLTASGPELLGHVSTLPVGTRVSSAASAIRCTPDGRFLYTGNRGHDSIAIFDISGADSLPRLIDTCPCGGQTPREIALSAAGDLLVVANQDSHNLAAFAIDPASGALTPLGEGLAIGSPVCVLFTA